MKRGIFFSVISLLLFSTIAYAGGIKEANHALIAAHDDTHKYDTNFLGYNYYFPISDYFGGGLTASATELDSKSTIIGSDSLAVGASLIFSDHETGKITLSYLYEETEYESTVADLEASNYTLDLEYFLSDFTLSAGKLYADYNRLGNANVTYAELAWYPTANMKLAARAYGQDADDNRNYYFYYQPAFTGQSMEFFFGVLDNNTSDGISLGLVYHFGNRVSMKERDRMYN